MITKNKNTNQNKAMTKQISIRLNTNIYKDLVIKAEKENRSVNNLVTWVMSNFIQEKKSKEIVQIITGKEVA